MLQAFPSGRGCEPIEAGAGPAAKISELLRHPAGAGQFGIVLNRLLPHQPFKPNGQRRCTTAIPLCCR